MIRPTTAAFTLVAALLCAGCASPKVWVERTESVTFPADLLNTLRVETHNGDVTCSNADGTDVTATVRIRAGGATLESANQALAAVDVVSAAGNPVGEHLLGWKWNIPRQSDWGAVVDFNIAAPAKLGFHVQSHNGDVRVNGMQGPCTLNSHNGDIVASVGGESLSITTHNGDVTATAGGPEISLRSHNGDIRLDAATTSELAGVLETHNGSIHARFGEKTSTELLCDTHNGRVDSSIHWQVRRLNRSSAEGKLGNGGRHFRIESHNGSIILTH